MMALGRSVALLRSLSVGLVDSEGARALDLEQWYMIYMECSAVYLCV